MFSAGVNKDTYLIRNNSIVNAVYPLRELAVDTYLKSRWKAYGSDSSTTGRTCLYYTFRFAPDPSGDPVLGNEAYEGISKETFFYYDRGEH